jgi:hypothetical protein
VADCEGDAAVGLATGGGSGAGLSGAVADCPAPERVGAVRLPASGSSPSPIRKSVVILRFYDGIDKY